MMRSYAPVLNPLGLIVIFFGLLLLVPLGVSIHHGDGAVRAYDEALLATLACGAVLWLSTHRHRRDLLRPRKPRSNPNPAPVRNHPLTPNRSLNRNRKLSYQTLSRPFLISGFYWRCS